MDFEVVDPKTLIPDPENVQDHPDDNVDFIMSSLDRFGQQKPLVVERDTRVVRAGNGTLEAVLRLEWPEVVVVWTDLKGQEARDYATADNFRQSEWNWKMLSEVIEADETGFFPEHFRNEVNMMLALEDAELPPIQPPEEPGDQRARAGHLHCTLTLDQVETLRSIIEETETATLKRFDASVGVKAEYREDLRETLEEWGITVGSD